MNVEEPDVRTDVRGREFDDWRWQLANRITTQSALASLLPDTRETDLSTCIHRFRMAITPYYASLLDPADPDCPLRRQCVPHVDELVDGPFAMIDPLGEDQQSPVPGVIHRYPDRALVMLTSRCAVYCRHCTRRRLVGREEVRQPDRLFAAVNYIREHTEIRDVIVSGGDPLLCSDRFLDRFLGSIRTIEHVEIVRIGTRVPVTMPQRITPELCAMLRRHHPLYVNTQFNHAREITDASSRACAFLADAGIPVGNQTVLLRGVNDRFDTLRDLLLGLVKIRVRPYYLYQCDPGRGMEHFRTPIATGLEIMEQLRGRISGLAIPTFVVDAPGGGGKIPLASSTIVARDSDHTVLRNYLGSECRYPDPIVAGS